MFFLMLFIDRDFCSGEQCGPWASCLVITLFKLINLCQYTFFQCQMHDGLLPPTPLANKVQGGYVGIQWANLNQTLQKPFLGKGDESLLQ